MEAKEKTNGLQENGCNSVCLLLGSELLWLGLMGKGRGGKRSL